MNVYQRDDGECIPFEIGGKETSSLKLINFMLSTH